MTVARARQISLDQTPYYHCVSRCVRRAFLCGKDRFTGRDFSHRREWIENRFIELTTVFAIELLAYAVMSNHFHVVLRVAENRASQWSDKEVIRRWGKIFQVPAEADCSNLVSEWRARLSSISWYMRCVNEPLARRANREDNCVGRFWQGRFKSQALLDDLSLLKCMTYVDLNPIRSGSATTLQNSLHTSAKARIGGNAAHLVPFLDEPHRQTKPLWIRSQEYLNLVHWTGRMIRPRRSRSFSEKPPPLLKQVEGSGSSWVREIRHYGKWYFRVVGPISAVERYREHLGVRWLKGAGHAHLQPLALNSG
ncbi:MAG: hypothetical protein WD448_13440 [Woeseia sp.]